jgi:CHAD domain-containing protein
MAVDSEEIERKYDVGSDVVFPNLADVEGVSSVRQPDEFQLEAVYFDTPDLDLGRRGLTLRRRSGGTDAGWHLKLPRSGDTRTEVHEPLGDDEASVPAALCARVRAIVRDRPLVPVARVSTVRREYALQDGGGTVLARVCDDQVQATPLAGGQDAAGSSRSDAVQSWREWELELDGGAEVLLDPVEEHLLAAGASPAASASKLARTLGDLSSEERAQPSARELKKGTARQVLVAHLAEHTSRLHAQDAAVRTGEAEGVHQLRIAARRLRSTLATCRPLLDREVTDPVRDELRWLGEVFGPARDAQVLREHLTGVLAEQPADLVVGEVASRVDDELSAAFHAGRERALESLDSARYLRLLDALDGLIASPPFTVAADAPAKKAVRRLLARDVKRLRREVHAIDSAEDPTARDIAFHEARKKAKRLRYAAEMAEPVLGKRARSLAKAAKKIQTALGVHQDSVVARQRLRELAMQAHLDGDNAFTFGRLHALEQARAEGVETEFADAWRTFRHKQLHRWTGKPA